MKLFDKNMPLPKYLAKHGKVHEIVMLLLTFVVMPIVSILLVTLTCQSVGLRVVQATVSMLAWYNGKFAEVIVWGALNIALFVYLVVLNLDSQRYSKAVKIMFYVACGLSTTLLIVGLSLKLSNGYDIMHVLHNAFATTGFCMTVIVLIALVATTWRRNITQAIIMTALTCFFIITGIFAIPQVNSPDSDAFITAAAQMYIFAMEHVILAVNYWLAKLTPNKRIEGQQQA